MAFEVQIFNSRGRLIATRRHSISSDADAREVARQSTSIKGRAKWTAVYTFMGKRIATYRAGVEVSGATPARARPDASRR